jgi:hypothetical protein
VGCKPARILYVGESIVLMAPHMSGARLAYGGGHVDDLIVRVTNPNFPFPYEDFDYVVTVAGVADYLYGRGWDGQPPDPAYCEPCVDARLQVLYGEIELRFGTAPIVVPPTFVLDDIPEEYKLDGAHLTEDGYVVLMNEIRRLLLERDNDG